MSIHGPADGWVIAPDGRKFWGRAGAAGLLVVDPRRRLLLQHRAVWSHFGDTWGIPGGARQFDESAVDGALRESAEEATVPASALRLLFSSVVDLDVWSYTTIVARADTPFEPIIADRESEAIAWVPIDEVDSLPLHPGFAASWTSLRDLVERPLHLVVDAANVVGSRPDGWWRDRVGATARLLGELEALALLGVPASSFGHHDGRVTTWWPDVTLVVEGQAAATGQGGLQDPAPGSRLRVVRAARDGDAAVVSEVEALVHAAAWAPHVVVVTADRALAARATEAGASVVGPGILRALLP